MGTKVSVLGHVGADEDGRFLLRCLGGVDTSCVIQSGISGKALILVEPGGERTIFIAPNANNDISLSDIDPFLASQYQLVHLTSFASPSCLAMCNSSCFSYSPIALASHLTQASCIVRLVWITCRQFSRCTTVFVNERELRMLTGKGGFSSRRPGNTRDGMSNRGAQTRIARIDCNLQRRVRVCSLARAILTVDTTGAGGNVYAAGFVAGLLRNSSLIDGTKAAGDVASLSTAGFGHASYPVTKPT